MTIFMSDTILKVSLSEQVYYSQTKSIFCFMDLAGLLAIIEGMCSATWHGKNDCM